METRIGGASVENAEKDEKAGRKAECVQTIATDNLMNLRRKAKFYP